MNIKLLRALALVLFFTFIPRLPASAVENFEGKKVTEVKIVGNKRINESTIIYYIHSKVGEFFSYKTVREDIQRIYDLGHFENVKVDAEAYKDGARISYILDEIPAIRNFSFLGNKEVKESEFLEKITITKGATYNKTLITTAVEKIKEIYQDKGYCLTTVEPKTKIIQADNQVDVTFQIKEGKKFGIEKIRFTGNKAFKDSEILKNIETKEKGWLSWLTRSGIYKKEGLKTDLMRIEMFYRDHGYLKAAIGEPVVDIREKEEKIYITIPIEEGPQYKISKISFAGDDTFTEAELRKKLSAKEGEIFSLSKLREDIGVLSQMYSTKGFAYADIIPQRELNDQEKTVSMVIQIDKGEKTYIGKITIKGNASSRDKVIRREFRLAEGELFDSEKLQRTKQRIMNTGFFEDVKITTKKGDDDKLVDIDVDVKERPTGSISAGVGYSSYEKTLFNASIAQNNFLGYGQRLSFESEFSSIRQNFLLNFTEPYLFDREIQGGVDLYKRKLDYYNYSSDALGGGLNLGKAYGEYIKTGMGYQFEEMKISKIKPENETNWFYNRDDITSRVTPYFMWDSRDDYFNPTKGSRAVTRGELAGGPLGGLNFYKLTLEGTYYHPLFLGLIGMVHGKAGYSNGYGGDSLPNYERFYMGGSNDLRGFSFDEVGPMDNSNYSMGGNKSLLFNAEVQYQLFKNFRALVFYDRGNVYGSGTSNPDSLYKTSENYSLTDMRHSVGVGVRFFSPVGPIGLAYGWKLDKKCPPAGMGTKECERAGDFHFTMGGAF
ncbi:MAG: outer membrane protein assembly factor BamA [Nitrospinae bacterium]|nr:outer membrane protein assembly factor BamA [Nitrospinota bacterium]